MPERPCSLLGPSLGEAKPPRPSPTGGASACAFTTLREAFGWGTTPGRKGGRHGTRPTPDRYKARPSDLGIDTKIPPSSPWALGRHPPPWGGNPAQGDCHRRPKLAKSGSRGIGTNSRGPSHSGGPPRLVGHPRRPRPRSRPHGVRWLPPLAEGRSERHTTAARSVQSPPQGPRNGYQDLA